jgi:hypothetical protein
MIAIELWHNTLSTVSHRCFRYEWYTYHSRPTVLWTVTHLAESDLKTAESKEDTLVLLDNVSKYFGHQDTAKHDEEVKNGTAQGFAKSLHRHFLLRPLVESSNRKYDTRVDPTRALQVAVLCKAIDKMLRCSDETLKKYGTAFAKQDLVPSLPRVIDMLTHWKGDGTIRLVTLSSAIRIMRRVESVVDQPLTRFVEAACILLQDEFPSDIRVDAAHALAQFLGKDSTKTGQLIHLLTKETCSRLVSILSTSAAATSKENAKESMDAILKLSRSAMLCSKIAKRRCCILAIRRNLFHENLEVRERAVQITTAILHGHTDETATAPSLFESNLDLITSGLVQAAMNETSSKLLTSLLEVLNILATGKKTIQQKYLYNILKVFYVVAATGDKYDDDNSTRAALLYLGGSTNLIHTEEVLSNVVDLATSEHANVRSKALDLIKDVTFWNPKTANALFAETALLESMSLIICHGSEKDCLSVLQISKQLVFDSANHKQFLEHDAFPSALVRFLTTEPMKHRPAFVVAIEVLLNLLSEENARCFVPHSGLLPWMVALANRTSSEDLKARLISAIIQLSSVILD